MYFDIKAHFKNPICPDIQRDMPISSQVFQKFFQLIISLEET